jgi:4'-phosphopantetheinyl transferase
MKPVSRGHLNETIVVWITKVSASQESLPYLESCLDSKDQVRAARFRFPEDRARFLLGRTLVRKSLGLYLHQSPETIELAHTSKGRPFFPQDETLQFSISHTRDLVAIALTAGAKVGIDLEYMRLNLDLLELARRILSVEDFQIFQNTPTCEKSAAFFRAWTRKEAYLKARGEGIAEGLQLVSVSLGAEKISPIKDAREGCASENWRLHTLPVSANYMGHLACDDATKQIAFCPIHFERGEVIPDSPGSLT